jgi:hypothetical protein
MVRGTIFLIQIVPMAILVTAANKNRLQHSRSATSAFGPKRTRYVALQMSAFGGKADIKQKLIDSGTDRVRTLDLLALLTSVI